MINIDDFRFKSHHLLVGLDAATNQEMMLVSAGRVTGDPWSEAVKRQKQAFEAWTAFLYESETEAIP
ncbi:MULTISPECIES: hypothetical protein [unclassified Pseudomonas]|uniref:hypothetical protein n=1 Tax=unclassified Pseudomonas TaxID=196821 RepID=UPI0010F47AFB|nr:MULTISPECIES: hypothetical protein [unclassified Pseudomonas]